METLIAALNLDPSTLDTSAVMTGDLTSLIPLAEGIDLDVTKVSDDDIKTALNLLPPKVQMYLFTNRMLLIQLVCSFASFADKEGMKVLSFLTRVLKLV